MYTRATARYDVQVPCSKGGLPEVLQIDRDLRSGCLGRWRFSPHYVNEGRREVGRRLAVVERPNTGLFLVCLLKS
jgi:hypothetical protein